MAIIFNCCHCKNNFVMNTNDFNCKIIRHAIYKKNYEQINPHSSKEICDQLVKDDLIYGCAKPLKIIQNMDGLYDVIICEYI